MFNVTSFSTNGEKIGAKEDLVQQRGANACSIFTKLVEYGHYAKYIQF